MIKIKTKLLAKYTSVSVEVRAAFWYTVCNTLLKALSLITVPIFTRILSESDYGIVGVYNGWHDIIFIIATLNLYYSAYNTAIIKYKEDLDAFTSSMIGLIDAITICLAVLYFCARSYFDRFLELPLPLLIIILVELLSVPAYNFWMARERFNYHYKNVVCVTLGVSIIAPILSLILVVCSKTNQAFFKIVGTAFPGICIGVILTYITIKRGRRLFHKEYWKYGLKFNIPLIPHYLSGTILNQSDRIMISKFVSPDKAGIYSVAYNASFTISILTTAINQSLVPWMYNSMKDKNYTSIRKRTNQILLVFSLMLVLFILIVPEVISILAPPSYHEATGILPVLVMSVYYQFLYGFFGTVDFYFEQSVYPMLASVVAALSNLISNYFLIPIYGYLVAGYTTLGSFIIMTFMHYFFMKYVLKKNGISDQVFDIKRITVISIAFTLVGFGESTLYTTPIIRYCLAITIFVIMLIKKDIIIKIFKNERKNET